METVTNTTTTELSQPTDISELKEGMSILATIKKTVKFGAFVDLGIGVDGLIHISKLSNGFVNDPQEIVSIGEQVTVKVIGIDRANNRISLSMRDDEDGSDQGSRGRDSGRRDSRRDNNRRSY